MSFDPEAGGDLLELLADALSWRDTARLCSEVVETRWQLVSDRFERMVAAFLRAGVGDDLACLAASLPIRSQERLLMAPEAGSRLSYLTPHDYHFFLNSLDAEGRLMGSQGCAKTAVWTGLGDYYFPSSGRASRAETVVPRYVWDRGSAFAAPRLSNGTPVDHVSPFATHGGGLLPGPYVCLTEKEVRTAVDRIEHALDGIAVVGGAVRDTVGAFTRVVVIRKEPTSPETFCSLSTRQYTGRIALYNVQTSAADVVKVANALIHEALHSALYIIEDLCPLIPDRAVAREVTVLSPWTGRSLKLHSFVHACFVWYGLWRFWHLAQGTGAFDEARMRLMRDRAIAGFRGGALHETLGSVAKHVSERGISAARRLADEVRTRATVS